MYLQENTLIDLEPKVKVTVNVAQFPLNHVTNAPVKFEVNTSTSGDKFSRKYIFYLTLRSRPHTILLISLYIM